MGIRQLPSGRWRLQIRRKGLTVDETFPTEAAAREALARYTQDKPRGKGEPTLNDAVFLYYQSLDYRNKRERTRDTEASRLKRILAVYGRRAVGAITADTVEEYIAKRLDDEPKPSADAIRLEVAALSAVMNFCRRKGIIAANPCIGVRRPAAAIKPRRLQQEDEGALIALLAHPNLRFRFAARLCLLVRETGARPGEWVTARFDDIDFERRTVTFQRTKYKSMPRSVPLTAAAERLLAAQLEDVLVNCYETFGATDFIFPAVGKGGTIRPMHYTGALRDMKKKGLLNKRVRAHTGRHEFISTLVESSDLDDSRIMSLVGHHSPASMEVYKHVRNVRFRPHIEEIEPLRRSQRIRALAASLEVPARLIEVLLVRERQQQQAQWGKPDDGEELLFSPEFIDKITQLATRLGNSADSRLQRLAELRHILTTPKQQGPQSSLTRACSQDDDTIEQALERVSLGKRVKEG